MVDQNVLSSRLNALERYLERLEAFSQIPLEEFLAEEDLHHLAERYLLDAVRFDRGKDLVVVEEAVNIARRIERREGLEKLLTSAIDEATDAADDARIAGLTKARRALTR